MLVHVERLKAKMAEQGLDAIVATTIENVHYFTGIWNVSLQMFPHEGQCYALVTADRPTEPFLISPTIEVDQVLDGFETLRGAFTFGTFYREDPVGVELNDAERRLQSLADLSKAQPGPLEALVAALKSAGLANGKIGVDELGLRRGFWEKLAEALPGAEFVPATEMLRWVRRVKTAEEIRRIRASARVTENAIMAAAAIARQGVTEYELAREFERSVVSQGGVPRFTLIRFGRNAVAGQVLPDRTPLRRGDTIWFDVGCTYQGYWSDLARNFSLGEPSKRAQTIYNAMLQGELHAIEATRAGMTGGEVFDLTLEATRAAGAPHYRRHHLGHGIGAEVYEQPLIAPGNAEVLEEGTVINIETPYYEYGLGALHVEDPFVVREGGNELLTTLGRELHIID
ncbi:MAG: Xaa-Pro peptidase family protein [Chloroflexota bacterium]|mgnify:CR=1 FL=1|nr:MAG: aminopeptidase P family protein [Chloroflexota bacterium]